MYFFFFFSDFKIQSHSRFVRPRKRMSRPKRARREVCYAESEPSSLTVPNPQIYCVAHRSAPQKKFPCVCREVPFSPASPSPEKDSTKASSRSSMPLLVPIWPPTLPTIEDERSRAPSPYDTSQQQELEAKYLGALLTSKCRALYIFLSLISFY